MVNRMRYVRDWQITTVQHHAVVRRGVAGVADVRNMQQRERRSDEVGSCYHMLAVQVTCRTSAWGTDSVLPDLAGSIVLHVQVSC